MAVCGVKPLSTRSVCLRHNVAMCLSSPMSHIPRLVLSQLRYHDCRMGGGVAAMAVNWELNWKRGVWRTDFMSSKCKRSTRTTACGRRQPWAMHFAALRTQKELWLTAIEKCITLKLCQAMCLHHLNSQTYRQTSAVATAENDVCQNPSIFLK